MDKPETDEYVREIDSLIKEKAELMRFRSLANAWIRNIDQDMESVNKRLKQIGMVWRG